MCIIVVSGLHQRPTKDDDKLTAQVRVFTTSRIILHPLYRQNYDHNNPQYDNDIALVSYEKM